MSYYEVLEVASTAPKSEIRKAFRQKAVLCHPDKFPNQPKKNQQFLELSEAYEILSDSLKRADYDKSISLSAEDQSLESRRLKRNIIWHRSPNYQNPYNDKNDNHKENDEIDDFFDALNK